QERIVGDLPTTVLGINPTVPGSRLTRDFADLREQLVAHRVYLNTTVDPWEDGYNLAMLEAMATGMPVVSTVNATSPIVDGVNGYVSSDTDELHEKLRLLLDDKSLAARLGAAARATVAEKFPISLFIERWNDVIADTVRVYGEKRNVVRLGTAPVQRRKILMAYTSNPTTTAAYIERGLRHDHDVVTCGPSITPDVLESWDMKAVEGRVTPQDIALDTELDMKTVIERMPDGFEPELFVWVESGINFMPPDLDTVSCPKVAVFIDSHINLEWHVQWARLFDHVFIAQRAYIDAFREAGCASVHWLPLGCDPEIHRAADDGQTCDKEFDISFVGSITPHNPRRRELIERLNNEVDVYVERCFLEEMASVFRRSRIVFNTALRDDLNMRVFEVMSCGAMLLSDEAPGSGFDDLFKHDVHFVMYFDETLAETARRCLDNPDRCAAIAAVGRQAALAHHTYRHRARQLVRTVFEGTADVPPPDIERIVRHVPQTAARILVCGGAAAEIARSLKDMGYSHVAGFERDLEFATDRTVAVFDELFAGDYDVLPGGCGCEPFDAVVICNLIESTTAPHRVLKNISQCMTDRGTIVVSMYNARWLGFIENLVEGVWASSEQFTDRHIARPMTITDLNLALARAGLEPTTMTAISNTERYRTAVDSGYARFGRISIGDLDEKAARELYASQFIVVAGKARDEYIDQVETYCDAGDYKKALRMLAGPMADAGPTDRRARSMILRARCWESIGDVDKAEREYRSAVDEPAVRAAATLGLARIMAAKDNRDESLRLLDQTVNVDMEPNQMVERGRMFLDLDRPERALDDFLGVLDGDAACKDAVIGTVEAARKTGTVETVLPYIDRYLELRGADIDMLVLAAGIDIECGRRDIARERIETALMFDPQHEEAARIIAELGND
ncbi:MAG: tetratricopeptide repeat protein, partial [Candidatus Hydrogenedentes bacterium]|nr:tetratricopeptide repeat protein [Candidatus Hydrogenedentota bacterium]